MTLRQSHFVSPVPLLVAAELGLLDDIDVELTRTTGSAEQLRGLLAGELDVVVTAIDNLFEWARADADLRIVAQLERTTPLRLYARPDVESIMALVGRRVAVDALTNGFALVARRLIEAAGVDVVYVEAGGVRERLEAIEAGTADATLLGPPFDAAAEHAGMRLLADANEELPAFPGQGLVVRSGILASPQLAAYLAALDRGVTAATAMTDAQGVALLERNGFGAAAASAWEARPRTLDVSAAGLALLTEIRADLGLLPDGVTLVGLHDPAALAAARRRVMTDRDRDRGFAH